MLLQRMVVFIIAVFGLVSLASADVVTKVGASSAQVASVSKSESSQTKVKINTASVKDLMTLKGMNASKARAIVAYRKKQGNFKSLDELKNVSGFKKMTEEVRKSFSEQLVLG